MRHEDFRERSHQSHVVETTKDGVRVSLRKRCGNMELMKSKGGRYSHSSKRANSGGTTISTRGSMRPHPQMSGSMGPASVSGFHGRPNPQVSGFKFSGFQQPPPGSRQGSAGQRAGVHSKRSAPQSFQPRFSQQLSGSGAGGSRPGSNRMSARGSMGEFASGSGIVGSHSGKPGSQRSDRKSDETNNGLLTSYHPSNYVRPLQETPPPGSR
ncbi:hypothetical protein BDZ45DRAFT_745413 [Acephala macrosclerotiorum]|nr:hypothetical protein BDZ45DRAFT_745413 [Acephala macrosclerotiorum]